jgi:hypothetical protein
MAPTIVALDPEDPLLVPEISFGEEINFRHFFEEKMTEIIPSLSRDLPLIHDLSE